MHTSPAGHVEPATISEDGVVDGDGIKVEPHPVVRGHLLLLQHGLESTKINIEPRASKKKEIRRNLRLLQSRECQHNRNPNPDPT